MGMVPEWLCEFTDPEGTVFAYDDIQAMLSDDVTPLWQEPQGESWLSDDVTPLFTGGV